MKKELRLLLVMPLALILTATTLWAEVEEYDCGACIRDHRSLCEAECAESDGGEKYHCVQECQKLSCAYICNPPKDEAATTDKKSSPCTATSKSDCSVPDKSSGD